MDKTEDGSGPLYATLCVPSSLKVCLSFIRDSLGQVDLREHPIVSRDLKQAEDQGKIFSVRVQAIFGNYS